MKIMKIGGSSLKSHRHIQQALELIRTEVKSGEAVVVVSAFGGVTDKLIAISRAAAGNDATYKNHLKTLIDFHHGIVRKLADSKTAGKIVQKIVPVFDELTDLLHGVFLVKELSPKTLDFILSAGERISALIISEALCASGKKSVYVDSRKLIRTDASFGQAKILQEITHNLIREQLKPQGALPVVTGYIGSTESGETTTFGRGGSDLTATTLAVALSANEVEIWTHVDGIMSADPAKVPTAIPIETMSYEEVLELSHFGAKVIRPMAMHPIIQSQISVRIRNTNNPSASGTRIEKDSPSAFSVKGISSIDRIAILRLQGSGMMGVVGIASRLFSSLMREDINIIMISQTSSEHSICIGVCPGDADAAKKAIDEEFAAAIQNKQLDPAVVEKNLSIVAVVGDKMRATPGIAGRMFESLGKNGINIAAIAQGSSERNISAVIPSADETKALNALHDTFFLSGRTTIHLFVVGTGLIGGTLLNQIHKHRKELLKNNTLNIVVAGVGDIDHMLFSAKGLSLASWREELAKATDKMDLKAFADRMIAMNLTNSIFVDATGNKKIVDLYESIFKASISLVTPNKIANSSPYETYARLHRCVHDHGVKFLYETNVGAGLPVISTLNDLLKSGDRIVKIEGVLSGTMSFIFNRYQKGSRFSEIVKEAKEKGYSEPDPRDDLNGLDVARKILILARECGYALNLEDIELENIMSDACKKAPTMEAFFSELGKIDPNIEARREAAEKRGNLLRYVATLENGKASVALREVSNTHPFATLSGSDNMIVFTTERYKEYPLVIKGPGAGAEVTAAGVFADILRIANYLS